MDNDIYLNEQTIEKNKLFIASGVKQAQRAGRIVDNPSMDAFRKRVGTSKTKHF